MTATTDLRLAHSPDPDDAFMWWPLLEVDGEPPRLDTGPYRFEAIAADIETLNARSETGDLEITAMSCAQYARVADRYALTACGASLGDGYGPKLVARRPMVAADLVDRGGGGPIVAVPGSRTSTFGAVSLMIGPGTFRWVEAPFDEIIDRVASGAADAGVVIHEGQLTYPEAGLHLVADLGAWWQAQTGLPMPLGVNAIRRDVPDAAAITALLRRSVEYALQHRDASIRYALRFARDMPADQADEFVRLYVNRWSLDFGDTGRAAVDTFLGALAKAGLVPPISAVDIVAAAG